MNIIETIAKNLMIQNNQVQMAVQLLDEGATVPFIARYRKEVTGNLDDTQLRDLQQQLTYYRELEERREVILQSIAEQNKLTPELKQQILTIDNKARLEDVYLPYKPKRRTKADIAKEAGLEALAMLLWQQPEHVPQTAAEKFFNTEKEITTVKDALEGARHILMELWSEHPDLTYNLREYMWKHAVLCSNVIEGKEEEGSKFADYFAYQEKLSEIPSHRVLAVLRGSKEKILRSSLELLGDDHQSYCEQQIASLFNIQHKSRPADNWLAETVRWTWKVKLFTRLELDLMSRIRERAEQQAITIFATNLKDLLMAAPAGAKITMGLDPGFRTGVKIAIVDETGKLLTHDTIFPHAPQNQWDKSLACLADLCQKFKVGLISIGNGTASRETDRLVIELIKKYSNLNVTKIVVSEAGASVYSASKLAAEEFPNLDVSYRGAVSIARRLQDPLAELVKIDPKSIGVGQYQHDVSQVHLMKSLNAVVEDCVNAVGVDVNTASVSLLTRVSGLNETLASNIVEFRNKNGAFLQREELKKVPRFGEKTFEQAAGFLRIVNGQNALDASAVHPEAYCLVNKILSKSNVPLKSIMGNKEILQSFKAEEFVDDQFGIPTIKDIFRELEKPGRDPRPEFKTATFKDGVETLDDLVVGMKLQGVITNITYFGAFVDIGVHQEGLVHKSQLSTRFVEDPREIVKIGQIVDVTILEIDKSRKRISLSMVEPKAVAESPAKSVKTCNPQAKPKPEPQSSPTLFAEVLKKALE